MRNPSSGVGRKIAGALLLGVVVLVFAGINGSRSDRASKERETLTPVQAMPSSSASRTIAAQSSVESDRHAQPTRENRYSCDGRQHCSQMRSYDEALYFIRNCPNTKMDGDGDGEPCEQQFSTR